jgi:hypothetical protein
MTAVLLVTSSRFVKLSDRRAAVASRGEPIVASREPPAHSSGRTIIRTKWFLAASLVLAVSLLGIGGSMAQTNAAMAATSPLGPDFSTPAASSQGTTIPDPGAVNAAPCSAGNPGTAALPTFDGGGISLSTNLVPSTGVGTSVSAPCNAVSASGVVSSSATAAATSAAIPGATAAVVAGLGASALGSTGLGAGLGSSSTMPGSTSPATSTTASSLPRYCSEATTGGGAASVNLYGESTSSTGAGGYAGDTVPNRTQGVAGGVYDPAQSLGGEASLPPVVPCISGE